MERDKALDMALGQIEKQYGKGAIMRMDEQAKVKIASIPTGALSLDLALGIGGLPRGRVVEIYGAEASGKCLTADTQLWTDRGLETVEELFERCGQPASCTSRVTDVSDLGVRVVNERGELEPVAALTHNNRRPVLRLRLKSGRTVSVTQNHPLRVVSERGHIVWRKAGDIEVGDTIVSAGFGAVEAAAGDGLTEDEAVLLGYLVAEGSLSNRSAIRFTNWDPEVGAEFRNLMRTLFEVNVRDYGGKEYAAHSKELRAHFADHYGLDYVTAAGKSVPRCVRTAGHKAQRAFLSALFEGDGWIDASSTIGLGTASETLAREVQLLLYGLGIPCTVSSKVNTVYQRDYWSVTINPGAAHRFLAEVGFRSTRRQAQVDANFHSSNYEPQFENIPHLEGLIRDLRDDARYTFEPVTAVEDGGLQPTFDIVVPGTHSFVANGILSHNTTLALHAIAEAQKAGGIAAFIDAEHALDPSYAKALGVDIEGLLVSQPDNGEQALEIADMLVRSGAVDVLVIDSVAALTPRAEIEGEMGDTHVGLQARLMSQALRKLAGTLNRSKTCAVFINQIREKVGVMFGCFDHDARIMLADGSQEEIGKIVNQRLPVEVLSYDPEVGRVVPKKVTNWFDNGPTDDFLTITVARGGGNGRSQFSCTPNHQIRTPGGWREAQELAVGDRVLQAVEHHLSAFQWEVILGGLMGDGALSPTRSGHAARYRLGHGRKQVPYADWKASLLGNIPSSRGTNEDGAVFYDFRPLPELAELRRAVYLAGKKVLSYDYLKQLTPLALAIWYLDDATFQVRSLGVARAGTHGGTCRAEICVQAFDPGSQRRLQEHLRDEWGIDSQLLHREGKAILQFPTAETDKLQALIAPYVHPSMDDKLLPRHRGQFAVEPVFAAPRWELAPMPITALERTPPPADGRTRGRYDLEVDGTHNYFVDGVMVHNSPETQPGGRALKFYSSVRLDVRRIESLKDGTDFVGNRVRVKVVKNKCVAEGTRVFDPTTGLTHRIEDVVDSGQGTAVWAADKAGQLHVRPIKARMDQGEQGVIGLRLGGGALLRVTPDHRILTEHGWREAGELGAGDRIARPLRAGGLGEHEPVSPAHARLLGYLLGNGYVGADAAFVSIDERLTDDVRSIAAALGTEAVSHAAGSSTLRFEAQGSTNGVVELSRAAGAMGQAGADRCIPSAFFRPDISASVVANLLMGLWEATGWVHSDRRAGIRCGFTTAAEQLAWQVHWLLLRFGIASTVTPSSPQRATHEPNTNPVTGRPRRWRVTVTGIEAAIRFSEALPTWGPRGKELETALAHPTRRHQGGTSGLLSSVHTAPVLAYLKEAGVTAAMVAEMTGEGTIHADLRGILGRERLRRDRVARLADALDSAFLREVLAEELYYDRVVAVLPTERARTFDIEVEELHNFVADDVVVHNCAPPFKQAEFDILFGEGISKEGTIIDTAVEHGIVKKAGAWYTYEGEQLGQGRENARTFLKEHDEVAAEIYKKVTERLGLVPTDVTGDEVGPEADGDEPVAEAAEVAEDT